MCKQKKIGRRMAIMKENGKVKGAFSKDIRK